MDINEWLTSGQDYKKGVELYARLSHNSHLLTLFRKAETAYNREKLRYELKKLQTVTLTPEKEEVPLKPIINGIIKPVRKSAPGLKPISFYPPELHETYHDKVSAFYRACSLKIKLNEIPEEEEEEALSVQFEIFRLWEINDRCFDLLKHYEQTKRILPYKVNYDLTGKTVPELFQERQKLYQCVSKRQKTLTGQEQKYELLEEGKKKVLLLDSINKKKEELQTMKLKIQALTEKINDETAK